MKAIRVLALLLLAITTLSVTPVPACADSWMLPTKTTYTSCAGRARITVVPRDLASQLGYYEDKIRSVEPAGQRKMGQHFATARLEQRTDRGWRIQWEHRIANDVAPVQAIVRDDGAYSVTFDNWGGVGYGPHVVVIYNADGKIVRALALSDLVPADYIKAMPHSVSSIDWRGEPRFSTDGQRVLIPVVIPTENPAVESPKVTLAVDLTDGRVFPLNPMAWAAALERSRTVLAHNVASENAAKAAFLAPLLGPKVNAELQWHDYLREAVWRRMGDRYYPSTTVLRLPEAADYAISETWVHDALTESYADKVALASLSPENLVNVLAKIAKTLPDRALSKVTVFIALPEHYWPAAVTALHHTGAHLIQLDPNDPIPQRPERIRRSLGPHA